MKLSFVGALIVILVACAPSHSQSKSPSVSDFQNTNDIAAAETLDHVAFETVPTRPMVLVDDRLFVTNPQDNRIEIFDDSVSIIDITKNPARVNRTLLVVGDEPRDIVFAKEKAFISTAHSGQHRIHPSIQDVKGAGPPDTHNPGTPRADVWVFDV